MGYLLQDKLKNSYFLIEKSDDHIYIKLYRLLNENKDSKTFVVASRIAGKSKLDIVYDYKLENHNKTDLPDLIPAIQVYESARATFQILHDNKSKIGIRIERPSAEYLRIMVESIRNSKTHEPRPLKPRTAIVFYSQNDVFAYTDKMIEQLKCMQANKTPDALSDNDDNAMHKSLIFGRFYNGMGLFDDNFLLETFTKKYNFLIDKLNHIEKFKKFVQQNAALIKEFSEILDNSIKVNDDNYKKVYDYKKTVANLKGNHIDKLSNEIFDGLTHSPGVLKKIVEEYNKQGFEPIQLDANPEKQLGELDDEIKKWFVITFSKMMVDFDFENNEDKAYDQLNLNYAVVLKLLKNLGIIDENAMRISGKYNELHNLETEKDPRMLN